jgi:hypothetical protein
MVWHWLGHVPAQSIHSELVSAFDFALTIRDLLEPLPNRLRRRGVRCGQYCKAEMASVGRFKLVLRHNGDGPNEFFVLAGDPHEKGINLFALAHNVNIKMNAREVKEVLDEVYKMESTVISARRRGRWDGCVRGQIDASRTRPRSFPSGCRYVAPGGRERRVLLAGDPNGFQAGPHANQLE